MLELDAPRIVLLRLRIIVPRTPAKIEATSTAAFAVTASRGVSKARSAKNNETVNPIPAMAATPIMWRQLAAGGN